MGDVVIEVLGSEPPSVVGIGVGSFERWLAVGVCLGWSFQDAGGWLVDVVDEDPARGWILSGGQFCKDIDGIIVPSRDMMQFDPMEFVLELAHLLAVQRHERALTGGLLHDLVDDQL